MLVIRFARTGKKKQAYFRVVVAEKERAVGAKFVEILGNYNPHAKSLTIDKDRLAFYLKNGAQPSNTVAKVLAKEKFELPKWVKITEKKKAPKKEPEVKEAPKAEEAPAETSAESEESTESTEVVEEVTEATAEEAPAEESAEQPEEAPAEESNSASEQAPMDKQEETTEETVETSEEDNK